MPRYTFIVPSPKHLDSIQSLAPKFRLCPSDHTQGPLYKIALCVQRTWPLEKSQKTTHSVVPNDSYRLYRLEIESDAPTILPSFDPAAILSYMKERSIAAGTTGWITFVVESTAKANNFFQIRVMNWREAKVEIAVGLPKSFLERPMDGQQAAIAPILHALGHTIKPEQIIITPTPRGSADVTVAGKTYSTPANRPNVGLTLEFSPDMLASKKNATLFDLFEALGPAIVQCLGPIARKPVALTWNSSFRCNTEAEKQTASSELDKLQSLNLGPVAIGMIGNTRSNTTPFDLLDVLKGQPNPAPLDIDAGRASGSWRSSDNVKFPLSGYYSLALNDGVVLFQIECAKNPTPLFVDHLKFIPYEKPKRKK